MEEKRKSRRVPADSVKIYKVSSADGLMEKDPASLVTAVSADISENGLQLVLTQKLPVDTQLNIILTVLPLKTPIAILGKVVWARDGVKEKQYTAGIEFVKFSDEIKKKVIIDYVNQKK